ncbi:MAG: HYR domain-containing protein [Planctomycetes bacterium]|nr:HYR domain-containing protein [Planctomycetota bacterium]
MSLLAACGLVVLGSAEALAITRVWTNPAGGNWNNAANWGGGVPAPSDECMIVLDGDYTVTLDANVAVISLVLGGGSGTQTFVVPAGRTFTLNGPTASSVGTHGVFEHQSASVNALTINAAFTNSGLFVARLSNANVDVNGSFTNAVGGVFRVQSSASAPVTLTFDGSITNDGTLEMTSGSVFSSTLTVNNGTLTNSSSGVVNSLVGAGGTRLLTASIDNRGVINLAATTTITRVDAVHSNSGSIFVNAGTASINLVNGANPGPTTFTNTGTISIAAGATLSIDHAGGGGTNTIFQWDGGSMSGSGSLQIGDLTWNLGQSCTIAALQAQMIGTVVNGPGTLTNPTDVLMNGVDVNCALVNSSGGHLTVDAPLTDARFDGGFSNQAGATLELSATVGTTLLIASGFTNHGTIELGSASSFDVLQVSAGTLVNAPDGVIRVPVTAGTNRRLVAALDNQGLFDVDRNASWEPLSGSTNNVNTGQIDVSGGTLNINMLGNVVTNSGAITIAGAATVATVPNLGASGTFTFAAGGSITGAGTLDFNGLSLANVNVPFTNTLAELKFRNCADVSGLATLTNQTVITQTGGRMNAPVVNDSGATYVIRGGSNLRINSSFDNRSGALLSFEGGSGFGTVSLTVADGTTLTNHGEIRLVNASALAGDVTLTVSAGSLVNQTDGLISFPAGTTGTRTLTAQLDNRGRVDIQFPVTINKASADHVNESSGEIDIVGGNLIVTQSTTTPTFDNAGTIAISAGRVLDVNGGTLTNSGSGIISGNGTIDSAGTTFSNAAIVRPGSPIGIETFTGPYPQTATGRLEIEIGGTTPGTQHDRVDVTGAATLTGTLQVTFVNGFVPVPGQSFTVLSAATRTGTFSGVDVIGYPDCILETLYSATDVQVRVEQISPTPICRNISVDLDATGHASITAAQVDNGSTDNCQVATLAVAPNTFDCSNLGANTVTLTVTDIVGNFATCNSTVTVVDNIPPSVICQNATVFLDGSGNAAVMPAQVFASGSDNCGSVNLQSVTPSTFTCSNLGANTVTLMVNDGHGNAATCTATVTVIDNVPPTVNCQDITVDLDAMGNVAIMPAQIFASGADNCGTVNLVSVVPSAFTCSNIGANTVTLTVNDGHGNTASCTSTVTVRDATAPAMTCPASVDAECTSASGAVVKYSTPSATDACDASPTVSCVPVSGSTFAFGPTTVTCTASDHASPANTRTCMFTVTVRDTTAPSISCPPLIDAECQSSSGAIVTFSTSAPDACDASPVVSCSPSSGSLFPIGMTTVNCTATDAQGNSASCSFAVSVGDVTIVSVRPNDGSEDGDDVLKIAGCNFTNVGDTTVLFGSTPGTVLAVTPDRITVRTPAGSGTVDVTVTNSNGSGALPASYAYLDRVTAARVGDVNVCGSGRADVFFVNGSAGTGATREVDVAIGAPITLAMDPSPAGPATGGRYVLWVWRGASASPHDLSAHGATLGHVVDPTPLNGSLSPQPFRCLRSSTLPTILCRGVTELHAPPTVPWSINRASGVGRTSALLMQGLVRDLGAGNSTGFSVTNAVLLRIQ